jgi:hypothetical protein
MLDNLLEQCRGRELVSKDEIGKQEVGVEIGSAHLRGYYAFPDGLTASTFMREAAAEFVMETGEIGLASTFKKRPWWKFWE